MTIKEITFELEQMQKKSWILSSLTLAVSDALNYGPNAREDFEGSLQSLVSMTSELETGLDTLTNELFSIIQVKE